MAASTLLDHHPQIAVIGLGYVGLPLAVAFGRSLPTIGFDADQERVRELQQGRDRNGEVREVELLAPNLRFTTRESELSEGSCFIIAVPTPVDRAKRPDFSCLVGASVLVGRAMRAGCAPGRAVPLVVYESTVYPGCTEEVCVPVLEEASGLRAGRDFKVGYSPERINPGDSEHGLDQVVKVVAGQDEETGEAIAWLYGLVAKAGVHRAPDIRTAEAAKVIENIQRDLNIALMNELAVLFHDFGLDTRAVLDAARTKWNFLAFEPGLVGGHCIPVDPYYLTHKAQEIGYHPEVILAGRRINDSMGLYVARQAVRLLIAAGKAVKGARVLVLGVAFKEDVRDARNSRVVDLVAELLAHGVLVDVHDPLVPATDLGRLGAVTVVADPFAPADGARVTYDGVVIAVPHLALRERALEDYLGLLRADGGPGVLVDVKAMLKASSLPDRVLYWSL